MDFGVGWSVEIGRGGQFTPLSGGQYHRNLHSQRQKVFQLKDGILSQYNCFHFTWDLYIHKESKNISLTDFYSELRIHFPTIPSDKYTGFFILSSQEAYLYYHSWQTKYDLDRGICLSPFQKRIKNYDENSLIQLIQKQVIFNPPIGEDYSGINLEYYNKIEEIFINTLSDLYGTKDYDSITENNYLQILKEFYSRIFENKSLHNNSIGGNLDIATIVSNSKSKCERINLSG